MTITAFWIVLAYIIGLFGGFAVDINAKTSLFQSIRKEENHEV